MSEGSVLKDKRSAGTLPGECNVIGSASAGSFLHLSLSDLWVLPLVKDLGWFVFFKKLGQERKNPHVEMESSWPVARIRSGRFWVPGVREAGSVWGLVRSLCAAIVVPGSARWRPFEILPYWLFLIDVYVKPCGWGTWMLKPKTSLPVRCE